MDANHPHFLTFCATNLALFSCCNVMWLDNWSEKSMHFVVQRQLTDVSDCKKNNLPQLLTLIHKSQLMHGVSPRDFVTCRNNLCDTARVSVSELYQMKPIAFRWTGASSTHVQLFFVYPGRSEQTIWEKLHEALRLIGSTSSTESSLPFTLPSVPSHRKNQPSIVKRSILDSRLTTRCHAYPHLLSRHGQRVPANVHSKGLHISDSFVVFGAVS